MIESWLSANEKLANIVGIEDINDPPNWVEHAKKFHGLGTLVTSDETTQRLIFEVGQLRHRRLARLEASQSAGDGDDGCAVLRAPVGGHDELVFVVFFDLLGALAQGEAGLERLGLFHQAVHQFTRQNRRVSRDVVDGLFGVNLRALTTGLRQGINQVATQFEQSGFKHRKETTRAGSNDEDIRLDHG